MVRVVMLELFRPQEAHYGLVWAEGEHNIVFYLDDGRIAGHKPIWVQTTLTSVVRMFKRVGMQTNLGNTKSMVWTPGFIWGQQMTVVYKQRVTGEGGGVPRVA